MKVTYIEHSSFLIEFESAYFLFDYFEGVLPTMNEDKEVFIFVSHRHQDHFSWKIFSLFPKHKVTYILAYDIDKNYNKKYFLKKKVKEEVYEDILFVKARTQYERNALRIETLLSTDEGVAFIIHYEGKDIYHAGDLNLWCWKEESDQYNQKMIIDYQKEIKHIENRHFDVAFVVLDPRQEEDFYLGFDYFMKHTHTDIVYPMHMWGDHTVIDALLQKEESSLYRKKIQKI